MINPISSAANRELAETTPRVVDRGATADVPRPDQAISSADYYRRRERELLALQETTLDLNRLRNTGEVLGAIVRRSRNLVGSAICYLSAYDQERGDFFMRACEGAVSKKFQDIRVPRNLGSCHHIIESKSPFVTDNYKDDPRFIHGETVDTTLETEGIIAMAAVPLLLDSNVLGILYVADRHSRSYAPEEVALLVSLGTHAALALENTRLLEETRSALKALEAKNAVTQEAIAVHEQLISLVVKGGKLDDVAKMLSSLLQAGVAVLDHQYETVCLIAETSGTNAGAKLGQARNRPLLLRALSDSRSTGRSVAVTFAGMRSSVATTIVSATQILGAIVVWRDSPFSDHEIRTLERGSIVCGIVLLSLDRAAKGLERDVANLFGALRNRNPESQIALAHELEKQGIDPREPIGILVIDIKDHNSREVLQTLKAGLRSKTLAGEYERRLVLFAAHPESTAIASAATTLCKEKTGFRPNIIVTSDLPMATQFHEAFEKSNRCLELLAALGRDGVISTAETLSVYAVMFADQSRDDLDKFVRQTIGPVIDYDYKKGGALTETLGALLDCGFEISAAAKSIGVHQNTVRQRSEHIIRLIGDWRSANRQFEVYTATKLHMLATRLASGYQ